MKRIGLLGRFHLEANGAAIAMCGRFTVQRLGNAKVARGAALEVTLNDAVVVGNAGANAQRAEHDVAEHGCLLVGTEGMVRQAPGRAVSVR